MSQKGSPHFLWILAASLSFSPSAETFAQAGSGTIDGIVFDTSGSVVPSAQVTLIREGTGDVRHVPTNNNGFFSFGGLPAASYTLEVEFERFSKFHEQGIAIHSGDKITLRNIALRPGTLSEVLNVTDGMENLIPVDNGEKASVITSKEIENISIIGRSAVELLKIIPGAVNSFGDTGYVASFLGGVGSYNVAGSRNEALDIVSDGANVSLPFCNCGVAVTPNVEMISEFKVLTASFGAENTTGPVVINSVSKSGTKDFHGAAYLYARNYAFNSKGWQANRYEFDKPQDSFYFPGFNIGGPVLIPGTQFNKNRDKLFFFAGVEWTRQNVDEGVRTGTVPTAKMRQGDFSEIVEGLKLATPDIQNLPKLDGNPTTIIDPSLFDKGGQVLMGLLPLPNRDPARSNGFNYVSNIVSPQNRFQGLTRIDYNISNSTKLYTRLNYEKETTFHPYGIGQTLTFQQYSGQCEYSGGCESPVPYPTRGVSSYPSVSSSTSLIQVFNPSTTNEIVFASTWIDFPRHYEDLSKISRRALGYPYQGMFKSGIDRIPNIYSIFGGLPALFSTGGIDPLLSVRNWIPSLADNFMKVKGTHSLKLGGFFQLTTSDGDAFPRPDQGDMVFGDFSPNSTGNVYADLLLGRPGFYQESSKNVDGKLRQRELTFYLQDNWKATRRLTFELGARFHHMGQWYDPRGLTAGFDPKKYDPAAPIDAYTGIVAKYEGDDVAASIFHTPALLVAPRFGFAYDLAGRGNTVLRGGFGSFVYRDSALYAYYAMGNPPLQRRTYLLFTFLAEIDRTDPAVLKPVIDVFDPTDNRLPTQYSWNFTVSHRLPGATILEASYVGNSSHNRMIGNFNINSVPEGAMFGFPKGDDPNNYRPYQSYDAILFHTHILTQNYNSLQVTFNRQAGRITYTGSYVFSKALGTSGFVHGPTSDSFDFRGRSYGVLSYDRTHAFKIAYSILLPSTVRLRGLREVLNGWQFSGITVVESGAPFKFNRNNVSGTMENGEFIDPMYVAGTVDTSANPLLTCDPRQGLGNNQYANVNCLAAPSAGHNGPYQIPYMRYPFTQNHDLSIFKNFPLSSKNESRKLQLRFSGYNFLNHAQPVLKDPSDTTLNFVNGVLDQDSKEKFGRSSEKNGRRVMQFAIKFMF